MYKSYYHTEHGLMYHVSALLVEDSVLVYQTEGAIFFCLYFVILTITKAYHIIYLTRQLGKMGALHLTRAS